MRKCQADVWSQMGVIKLSSIIISVRLWSRLKFTFCTCLIHVIIVDPCGPQLFNLPQLSASTVCLHCLFSISLFLKRLARFRFPHFPRFPCAPEWGGHPGRYCRLGSKSPTYQAEKAPSATPKTWPTGNTWQQLMSMKKNIANKMLKKNKKRFKDDARMCIINVFWHVSMCLNKSQHSWVLLIRIAILRQFQELPVVHDLAAVWGQSLSQLMQWTSWPVLFTMQQRATLVHVVGTWDSKQ